MHLPVHPIGVAGLIATQASFPVIHALTRWMAEAAIPLRPEVILGCPRPCLRTAPGRATGPQQLGRRRLLSVPIHTITTTAERRRLLDARMLPRLDVRRILLVDDVNSTGSSALAGLGLLQATGIRPVGLCVAMIQTRRWQGDWPAELPVVGICVTPLLTRASGGWMPARGCG